MMAAAEGESQSINRHHRAGRDRLQNMVACQTKWLCNWTRQFNGFAAAILGSAGEMGELKFAGGSEIKTQAELKWCDPLWHGRWTGWMHKFNFRPINYRDCAVIVFVAHSKSLSISSSPALLWWKISGAHTQLERHVHTHACKNFFCLYDACVITYTVSLACFPKNTQCLAAHMLNFKS